MASTESVVALPVHNVPLHVPTDEQLCEVLSAALRSNFAEVEVNSAKCPDLTQPPWCLAVSGLGGDCRIADIGGTLNLEAPITRTLHYNLADVLQAIGKPSAHVMGPGAGYAGVAGINCELMATAQVVGSCSSVSSCSCSSSCSCTSDSESATEKQHLIRSQCAKIRDDCTTTRTEDGTDRKQDQCVETDPSSTYLLEPYSSLEVGPLMNLLISDGDPHSSVIHVRVRGRIGESNLVSCMREALDAGFGEVVGLAGVFQVLDGKVHAHVMPGFPACYLRTDAQVQQWLHFFEMSAPLTCLSVMVSRQIEELDLRVEHTHFYSDHGCGGHYHYDTTPETVVYEGYFVAAKTLHRVAQARPVPEE